MDIVYSLIISLINNKIASLSLFSIDVKFIIKYFIKNVLFLSTGNQCNNNRNENQWISYFYP